MEIFVRAILAIVFGIKRFNEMLPKRYQIAASRSPNVQKFSIAALFIGMASFGEIQLRVRPEQDRTFNMIKMLET